MDNLIKKDYELSLWVDETIYEPHILNNTTYYDPPYFKEHKIGILGSSKMTHPGRAQNVIFTRGINELNRITFDIYSQYYDDEKEVFIQNPYYSWIKDEAHLKLKQDNEWFDFTIKEIIEDSIDYCYTVTATDYFAEELSKNGYGIILSPELNNNSGTIEELGEFVLEDTDWEISHNNTNNNYQLLYEPLYKVTPTSKFLELQPKHSLDNISLDTFTPGDFIYIFYSNITDKNSYLQFLYDPTHNYKINDDGNILKSEYLNYYIDNFDFDLSNWNLYFDYVNPEDEDERKRTIEGVLNIDTTKRGGRLIRTQRTFYDNDIQSVISIYEKDNEKYYSYIDVQYDTPNIVGNILVSGTGFVSTNGWFIDPFDSYSHIEVETRPQLKDFDDVSEWMRNAKNYLHFHCGPNRYIYNQGINTQPSLVFPINENREGTNKYLDILAGTKYVFRYKASALDEENIDPKHLKAKLLWTREYTVKTETGEDEHKTDKIVEITDVTLDENSGYYYGIGEVLLDVKYSMLNEFWLGIYNDSDLYYEDIQFFQYKTLSNGDMATPGMEILPTEQMVKYIYHFYKPGENAEIICDEDSETFKTFIPIYNENFCKIRNIEVQQSNRFNILQDLCESFECWHDYEIARNIITGEILLEPKFINANIIDNNDIIPSQHYYIKQEENYIDWDRSSLPSDNNLYYKHFRKIKNIQFTDYTEHEVYYGFHYGTNIKGIEKTVDSNKIVTKLIITESENKFAPNGLCDISSARDNISGANFILDLNYYCEIGVLNTEEVKADLYGDGKLGLNYLGKYSNYHTQIRNAEEETFNITNNENGDTLPELDSKVQFYFNLKNSTIEELSLQASDIKAKYNIDIEEIISSETTQLDLTEDMKKDIGIYRDTRDILTDAETQYTMYKNLYDTNSAKVQELSNQIIKYKQKLIDLDKVFNNKYSSYLKEGTWSSNEYYDNDLYYYDAMSSLNASKKPQVSYNIDIVDLSALEEYKGYDFKIGDKTYIIDEELFGNKKEDILITGIENNLDDPTKNRITVQNYRGQFQDIFQKMNATTQQVELKQGGYDRAADAVQTNGTLSNTIIENSIKDNVNTLTLNKDESIFWDKNGFYSKNSATGEQLRISNGVIYTSKDNGQTWSISVSASKIDSSTLTGNINVQGVQIFNKDVPTFIWNSEGLNAYAYRINEGRVIPDFNKYVRYDQYGLYGVSNAREGSIADKANFALTWDGFILNSFETNNHRLKISSNNDIQLLYIPEHGEQVERIKIGRLEDNTYGMQIKDIDGNISLKTNDEGKLLLRDSLTVDYDFTTQENPIVKIGYIDDTDTDKNVYLGFCENIGKKDSSGKIINHAVIDAKGQFIVYEDGSVIAKDITIQSGSLTNTIIDCGTWE